MSDCFQCQNRLKRSQINPDWVGCDVMRAVNYKDIALVSCAFFKQAPKKQIEAKLYFDSPLIGLEEGDEA